MHSSTGVIRTSETSLSEYFREQLARHARELEPPPQEDTCWYLGNLLVRFCRSEDFFTYESGRFDLRPLALLFGDAVEARDEHQRWLLLQQLGDMSLFMGALFPENYSRRGLGQDYLVGMGCGASQPASENAEHPRPRGKPRGEDIDAASSSSVERNRRRASLRVIRCASCWSERRRVAL